MPRRVFDNLWRHTSYQVPILSEPYILQGNGQTKEILVLRDTHQSFIFPLTRLSMVYIYSHLLTTTACLTSCFWHSFDVFCNRFGNTLFLGGFVSTSVLNCFQPVSELFRIMFDIFSELFHLIFVQELFGTCSGPVQDFCRTFSEDFSRTCWGLFGTFSVFVHDIFGPCSIVFHLNFQDFFNTLYTFQTKNASSFSSASDRCASAYREPKPGGFKALYA